MVLAAEVGDRVECGIAFFFSHPQRSNTMIPRTLAALLVFLLASELHAAGPSIRLNRSAFEVVGLDPAELAKVKALPPEHWSALLAVRSADGPPMLGSYRVEGNLLRFEPRFPLTAGVRYRVVFDPSRLPGQTGKPAPLTAEFTLPRPKVEPAIVEQVYPTRNKLPENQLKYYVHFSAPMSQGDSYRYLHLLTAAGKEIELPFLELGEELWDREGKRFTLFFDPGRIKRELKPREDLGPALEAGKSYTLVIDGAWEDAQGNPLKQTYRKTFQVVAPDREPIDEKKWKLLPPSAGKTGPLTVTFPEPLDHALQQRMIWVTDAKGQKVAGKVQVTDEETRWSFTPDLPWTAGTYRLVIDTLLEDLAGNKVGTPFEVDVFRPIQRQITTKTVELPFEVK